MRCTHQARGWAGHRPPMASAYCAGLGWAVDLSSRSKLLVPGPCTCLHLNPHLHLHFHLHLHLHLQPLVYIAPALWPLQAREVQENMEPGPNAIPVCTWTSSRQEDGVLVHIHVRVHLCAVTAAKCLAKKCSCTCAGCTCTNLASPRPGLLPCRCRLLKPLWQARRHAAWQPRIAISGKRPSTLCRRCCCQEPA